MCRGLGASLLAMALLAGCSNGAAPPSGAVEVLVSWTGSEADAFREVVRPFEDRTGIQVDLVTTRDLRGAIDEGLAAGGPPDIVGLEGPTHLRDLAARGDLMDLGAVIDLRQYKQSVSPTFVDLGSSDGALRGVFLKATLKGLLWYSPRVIRQGEPTEFADLQWMLTQYRTDGTKPWCVGLESRESTGWPGTDLIESFLIHQSGVNAYDRWIAGDLAWTSREVRRAFESYGRVVAEDAVYGGVAGAIGTSFEDSGDPLFTDPPGCLLLHQGSFMAGFFDADGRAAGVDYDVIPFPAIDPGVGEPVIGAGDLFGMLSDSPEAQALMRHLVSVEAQEILVSTGGALSVDERVDTYPNDLVHREADMLTTASHFRFDASDLMPAEVNAAFWQAVVDFTRDQSKLDDILERLDQVDA